MPERNQNPAQLWAALEVARNHYGGELQELHQAEANLRTERRSAARTPLNANVEHRETQLQFVFGQALRSHQHLETAAQHVIAGLVAQLAAQLGSGTDLSRTIAAAALLANRSLWADPGPVPEIAGDLDVQSA